LLVYYAGHGLRPGSGKGLYLASTITTQDDCEIDGISFDALRRIIANSPARKKILILDCCFSGLATKGEMGPARSVLSANIDISGTYSIASAPANKVSVYKPGDAFTAFTGHLIAVLREGVEFAQDFLTLDDVYDEVRRRIAATATLPEPQRQVHHNADQFLFARNVFGSSFVVDNKLGEKQVVPPRTENFSTLLPFWKTFIGLVVSLSSAAAVQLLDPLNSYASRFYLEDINMILVTSTFALPFCLAAFVTGQRSKLAYVALIAGSITGVVSGFVSGFYVFGIYSELVAYGVGTSVWAGILLPSVFYAIPMLRHAWLVLIVPAGGLLGIALRQLTLPMHYFFSVWNSLIVLFIVMLIYAPHWVSRAAPSSGSARRQAGEPRI
jgi:hypothetical protein